MQLPDIYGLTHHKNDLPRDLINRLWHLHCSAHACSEIGLKWFLFALHDLGTALGFVSVLDFFGDFVFLEHGKNRQTRN
jgi:hypothetical protein